MRDGLPTLAELLRVVGEDAEVKEHQAMYDDGLTTDDDLYNMVVLRWDALGRPRN